MDFIGYPTARANIGSIPPEARACPMMPRRVLIADDHPLVRKGVRILLEGNPQWEVCGEAGDGEEAVREIARLSPDVVILDVSMPEINGFEVAALARRIAPSTKIVFFTMQDVPATAQEIGAEAFVLKSSGVEVLLAAMERAVEGRAEGALFTPPVASPGKR